MTSLIHFLLLFLKQTASLETEPMFALRDAAQSSPNSPVGQSPHSMLPEHPVFNWS